MKFFHSYFYCQPSTVNCQPAAAKLARKYFLLKKHTNYPQKPVNSNSAQFLFHNEILNSFVRCNTKIATALF